MDLSQELHHTAEVAQMTVSIVSHGQAELVRALVANLDGMSHASIARLVLTVNIPEPDMLEDVAARFPIERIVNPARKGFGANHNQAFGNCKTPWFLVLNPDMHFEADILAPLLQQANAQSGLLAPRIREPGKSEPEQHRATITPLEILTRRREGYLIPAKPHWIPGLFMLFRSEAFAKIGGFDERFFMYGEDFDICARLQLAGWRLQIAENLTAVHDARRTSHFNARYLYWHLSSLLRVWTSGTFWRFRSRHGDDRA